MIYIITHVDTGVVTSLGYFTDEADADNCADSLNQSYRDLYEIYQERTEFVNSITVRENALLEKLMLNEFTTQMASVMKFNEWMSSRGYALYSVCGIEEAS